MVAKTLSFGLLYGQSGRSLKKLAMPMWQPSIVDRLAALADPDIARRVEEFDDPQLKIDRLTKQWEKVYGLGKTCLPTSCPASIFSTGSMVLETAVPSAGKRTATLATPKGASGES